MNFNFTLFFLLKTYLYHMGRSDRRFLCLMDIFHWLPRFSSFTINDFYSKSFVVFIVNIVTLCDFNSFFCLSFLQFSRLYCRRHLFLYFISLNIFQRTGIWNIFCLNLSKTQKKNKIKGKIIQNKTELRKFHAMFANERFCFSCSKNTNTQI